MKMVDHFIKRIITEILVAASTDHSLCEFNAVSKGDFNQKKLVAAGVAKF